MEMAGKTSSSSNFGRASRPVYNRRANHSDGGTTATRNDAIVGDDCADDSIRLVANIAYDGTNYEGFQTQASGKTIQDIIEVRLSKLFDHRIHVAASGRTDAGVHAKGQIIHFDVPRHADALGRRAAGHLRKALQSDVCTSEDIATLLENTLVADAWRVEGGSDSRKLGKDGRQLDNGNLPCDVQILSVSPAPCPNFHAREKCIGKRYVYTIQEGAGNPMSARYRWNLGRNKKLDVRRMNMAAQRMIGEIDFSSFGLIEEGDSRTPLKRMRRLEVSRIESINPIDAAGVGCINSDAVETDAVVTIVAECDRFLYNMMRMICGTLVEVGLGRLQPEDIATFLERKTRAGGKDKQGVQIHVRKAPAHGLCLHHCFYEPEETNERWMNNVLEPGSTEDAVQAALALLQL